MANFTPLKVIGRREEIDGTCCSIALEKPAGFDYKAGQHLPIRFKLNGREARRTYTLSSSPLDRHLQITVKRVKDGLVSNHINDTIQVGDTIEARPPIGHIVADCDPTKYRTLYLFAAGSGITPMWSIARTVLATEPQSKIYLLYGNQSEDSIIFREQLDELQKQHSDRFVVTHALSAPKSETWSALWRSDLIQDPFKGRIDGEKVHQFLDQCRPHSQECAYYICGPGRMNSSLRDALLQLQVPTEDIHIEYFKAPDKTAVSPQSLGVQSTATVQLNGRTHTIQIPQGKTILQAAQNAGIDPPYSCEAGICGTCRGRLESGQVDMPSAAALTPKQIQQGEILTCQSWPTSEKVTISFDHS